MRRLALLLLVLASLALSCPGRAQTAQADQDGWTVVKAKVAYHRAKRLGIPAEGWVAWWIAQDAARIAAEADAAKLPDDGIDVAATDFSLSAKVGAAVTAATASLMTPLQRFADVWPKLRAAKRERVLGRNPELAALLKALAAFYTPASEEKR